MDRNEQKNNFQNVQNKRKRETKKGGVGGILTVIAVVVLAACIGVLGWQLNVSSSRISKQSADISNLEKKVGNLEVALTPTPEPEVTPDPTEEPTPTPEVISEPPAGVSKDDQGMVIAYGADGDQIKIESNEDRTIKVYDADGNLKNDDSLYDDQRRVVAYDENGINGIKIRVERNETADLEVHDADGNLLFK